MLTIIFATALQSENTAINNFAEYPSVAGLFFRIILSFIFILLVVYLVLKILNKQQNLRHNQKNWIKILDYQALGSNRGLYLIELYDITCIIAASEGQITILKEINTGTEKWQETKETLVTSEDLISKGLGRLFNGSFSAKKPNGKIAGKEFQQQLAEQLRRTRNLSWDFFKGRGKRDE
jgi:flagellar biogenesis protein FliO